MNNSLLIDERDLNLTKNIFKGFEDVKNKDRIIANTLGSKIAINYFEGYNVDAESGLHNIGKVLQNIDISDIYVNENYIDVRLYFNENELSVPKSHFDLNILPVAYMFIKLNEDLTEGVVTGFLRPDNINTSKDYDGYYQVFEKDLVSFYDIETHLTTIDSPNITSDFENQVYEFIDESLQDYTSFLKTLILSKQAREFLYNATKTSQAFEYISVADLEINEVQDVQNLENTEDLLAFTDINIEDNIEEIPLVNNDLDFSMETTATLEEFENVDLIENDIVDTIENEILDENIISLNEDYEEKLEENSDIVQEEEVLEIINTDETEAFEADSADEDFFEELEETDFTTNTTPSLIDIEDEPENNIENSQDEVADRLIIEEEVDTVEAEITSDNLNTLENEILYELENEESSQTNEQEFNKNEEINELFGNEKSEDISSEEEDIETEYPEQEFYPPKRKSKIVPILGILVLLAGIGYGISKMNPTKQVDSTVSPSNEVVNNITSNQEVQNTEEAMPTETIESTVNPTIVNTNEGNAVAIPAIEQNLDASILVSNLSVNWEVPSAYISNSVAKRYFTKLGKIIQLNLKTELLLLSKPPITNKIAIELEFNKNSKTFDIKDLTASSGESIVDEVVKKAVKNALSLKLSTNMSVFNTIQGNPTLVIRL